MKFQQRGVAECLVGMTFVKLWVRHLCVAAGRGKLLHLREASGFSEGESPICAAKIFSCGVGNRSLRWLGILGAQQSGECAFRHQPRRTTSNTCGTRAGLRVTHPLKSRSQFSFLILSAFKHPWSVWLSWRGAHALR